MAQATHATVAEDGRQWQLYGYRETRFEGERVQATKATRSLLKKSADTYAFVRSTIKICISSGFRLRGAP